MPPPLVHSPRITPPRRLPSKPQPRVTSRSLRGATIVVDAGHGGKDPGAWKGKGVVSRLPEKTIVLDIARKLSRLLADRGANVVMTRTTDVDVTKDHRAALAERSHADLFVSIHANSIPKKPSASGAEVYMYTQASDQSQKAAHRMIAAFKRAGIHDRGIQRRNFHVLREHSRPAMLIECGFLSNTSDSRKLNSDSYRSRLAAAIADGIGDYFAP